MADTGNLRQVISDEYREMQESLHEDEGYGVAAESYAPLVALVVGQCQVGKILDYGSGKGSLREYLPKHLIAPVEIDEYDPAIPGKEETPDPAELVVCIEVLEHVEPDMLDNVLDDLVRVTDRFGFFTVSTGEARKVLPDGRNVHLIQEDADWWWEKLSSRFKIHSFARTKTGFWVTVLKKA